jgi:hypothetical protein
VDSSLTDTLLYDELYEESKPITMTGITPALLLLLLLATASASLAHVLWGKRWLHLVLFWLAAAIGSFIPYLTGLRLPLDIPTPAGVSVLESVLMAWIGAIVASRLRV